MYTYRVGEQKSIAAQIFKVDNPAQVPVAATALVRLYAEAGTKLWERTAVLNANEASYVLTDINKRGNYLIQWVIGIGNETLYSDPMKLQVKNASEV